MENGLFKLYGIYGKKLNPKYLTLGIEINSFEKHCRGVDSDAFSALVEVINDAYDHAKSIDPKLLIFPSFQVGELMEIRPGGDCYNGGIIDFDLAKSCLKNNLSKMSVLKQDRFSCSIYSHLISSSIDKSLMLNTFLNEVKDKKLVIAETGYPSFDLKLNGGHLGNPQCLVAVEYPENDQLDWVKTLMDAAYDYEMDFFTWWSNRDVFPEDFSTSCPCVDTRSFCETYEPVRLGGVDFDARAGIGAIIKSFQGMGLRTYNGDPKPALEYWLSK